MTEERKKRKYDEAHKRATMKYYEGRARIPLTVTKEEKERITQAAAAKGQSVNRFIIEQVLKGLQ